MGVKSTKTITRADADARYVRLHVQVKREERRAKRQRLMDTVGGIDAMDANAYHSVDFKLRADKWRTEARIEIARMSDAEMETLLMQLNDRANDGEGFENYNISEHSDHY